MDPRHDPKLTPPPVDETRRRLAKAGLAAPAVLGVLASRPVLGQSLHNCTPSGHISGFASPNPNGTICSNSGQPPSYYAGNKGNWPVGTYFINNNGGVRLFRNAPATLGVLFADAYQRRNTSNGNLNPATVWDVLKGFPVNSTTGAPLANQVLEAKSGFDTDLSLGAEAVAAVMNALKNYPSGFPISPQMVVKMFNNVVVSGGLDPVTSTATWNAAEVKAYFQSLHT